MARPRFELVRTTSPVEARMPIQQPMARPRFARGALEELLAAHRLWSKWLSDGQVRKIAVVAEKS
jgi:hypothetical protein